MSFPMTGKKVGANKLLVATGDVALEDLLGGIWGVVMISQAPVFITNTNYGILYISQTRTGETKVRIK